MRQEMLLRFQMMPIVERKRLVLSETKGVRCLPILYNLLDEEPVAKDFPHSTVPVLDLGSDDVPCTHPLTDLKLHREHAMQWRIDLPLEHPRHFSALLPYLARVVGEVIAGVAAKDGVVSVFDTGSLFAGNVPFTTGIDQIAEIAYLAGAITLEHGRVTIVSARFQDDAPSHLPRRDFADLPGTLQLANARWKKFAEDMGRRRGPASGGVR